MADNKQIKDGLGNLFTHRMRDVSSGQDGTFMRSMFLSTPYPLDYGGGGIFQHCARSGIFLTGIGTESPIYSFRWPASTMLGAIQRLRLRAWSNSAFAAAPAIFSIYNARAFSVQDTGGNTAYFADGSCKLRGSMSAAQASIIFSNNSPLTPGTRTVDASPLDARSIDLPTAATGGQFSVGPLTLFEKVAGEHPLILALNDGFVVRALVPGTGSWQFAITLEWAEIPLF